MNGRLQHCRFLLTPPCCGVHCAEIQIFRSFAFGVTFLADLLSMSDEAAPETVTIPAAAVQNVTVSC
jgi:hypothetical protein